MWLSEILNNNTVKSIYKNKIPSLNDTDLIEITILPGNAYNIFLRLDLNDLPEELPEKWANRDVNTIQLYFELSEVNIKKIVSIPNAFSHGNSYIYKSETGVTFKYISKDGMDILEIDAKFISIQKISGYNKDPD